MVLDGYTLTFEQVLSITNRTRDGILNLLTNQLLELEEVDLKTVLGLIQQCRVLESVWLDGGKIVSGIKKGAGLEAVQAM